MNQESKDFQSNTSGNIKPNPRIIRKKDAEKLLTDKWVGEKTLELLDEPQVASPGQKCETTVAESMPDADKPTTGEENGSAINASGAGQREQTTQKFELTDDAPLKAQEVADRVSVVVTQKKYENCNLAQANEGVVIRGDLRSLLQKKLLVMALHVKAICKDALQIESPHLSVTDLLKVDGLAGQARLGWEVSFPAAYLESGTAEQLQKCLQTFGGFLCRQEEWVESDLSALEKDRGQHCAAAAAKAMRKSYGDSVLPEETKIESVIFSCSIALGERVGPAPEPKKDSKIVDVYGAFRGVHCDKNNCDFSPDGLVQGATLLLLLRDDQVDEVHKMATRQIQFCTAKVKQYLEDDEIVQMDLVEIHSVVGELF